MSLLSVAEAQARLLAMATPLATEDAHLAEAPGRWLAHDLTALRPQPVSDLSAMDGYAIRHADLPGPWRIIGESAAGEPSTQTVAPGDAVRIYTGAALPKGADTVIIQEDVRREGDKLWHDAVEAPPPGKHIRREGSDFAAEQSIIEAGTMIKPQHVALAALAGHAMLALHRRPNIALVSTGAELVPPGAPLAPGQLPASNALMLGAMLSALPCTPIDCGIITDDLDQLSACLAGLGGQDIVVSTGGASVGDHDLVRPALEQAGGTMEFWKIRMRPGKPLICGTLNGAIFLGLPGNPVSAFVTATLFLLPLVRHMGGCPRPLPETKQARLTVPLAANGSRETYLRARVNHDQVTPVSSQDSAAVWTLSQANCLIRQESESAEARAGDRVDLIRI